MFAMVANSHPSFLFLGIDEHAHNGIYFGNFGVDSPPKSVL